MKPIVLKRPVQVHVFETVASIAVPEARPDLLAVVHLVADRGEAWGRDIGRDLLGMDDSLGWRVLERCQRLGLVAREGNSGPFRLTELGQRAVTGQQIFLPERAAYAFYWVDDPLLPEVILGFKVLESARDAEMRDLARDARDGQGPRTSRCPHQLQGRGDLVTEVLHDGGLVRLLELGDGYTDTAGTIELTLTLHVDQEPTLRLLGRVHGRQIDRTWPASDRVRHTHEAVWRHLVSEAVGAQAWTLDEWARSFGPGTLGRDFSEVPDAARRSFEERLSVDAVDLGHAGRFDGTSLTVGVAPESQQDADAWAAWLVWDGLHDHVSQSELDAHLASVGSRFPHHRVELPDPRDLLNEAHGRLQEDHRAWRLVAPADLGLWEVTPG